ncbi:hypothetical protein ACWIID_33060 [Streptomyces phaeochromogenes]
MRQLIGFAARLAVKLPPPSCVDSNRTLAAPRRNIGDFDCSGEDVERDWVARTRCWSRVRRVLLTYDQVINEYELPATEGKHRDPRWPAFARRYGFDIDNPVQWEVEALAPDELQRLVLAAVDPYIDRGVLAEQIVREEQQRRALSDFLGGWGAAGGASP